MSFDHNEDRHPRLHSSNNYSVGTLIDISRAMFATGFGHDRTKHRVQTSDCIVLRGWFYTLGDYSYGKLLCPVVSHGFSAVKEMVLDHCLQVAAVDKLVKACISQVGAAEKTLQRRQ